MIVNSRGRRLFKRAPHSEENSDPISKRLSNQNALMPRFDALLLARKSAQHQFYGYRRHVEVVDAIMTSHVGDLHLDDLTKPHTTVEGDQWDPKYRRLAEREIARLLPVIGRPAARVDRGVDHSIGFINVPWMPVLSFTLVL